MNLKTIAKRTYGYIKLAISFIWKYLKIVYKWLRSLSKQELKNYSLNLISILLILTVFCTSLGIDGADYDKFDIFDARKITENIKNLELNMTTVIYAKNSEGDWEEYKRVHGDENRIWISLKKIPDDLQKAFIAIEDEDFEKHGGVDWQRTIMAVANQFLKFSEVDFGASTITQQLIKNITSDNEKVYTRKVREIIRALFVDAKLSKDEILEAYLNTIALGNGINGVQVAANYYFSKEVKELTLAECAAIAAITKNPSRYNPVTKMEENTKRRRTVLQKMYELGFITKEEFLEAYDEEVKLDFSQKENLDSEINDYFIDTLIDDIIGDLAEKYDCEKDIASQMFYNGGYKVYATIDPSIQTTMEETYQNKSRYFYEKRKNEQGEMENVQSAMTIMDYKGHIVGIVGGTGEKTVNRGLNRAYNVPRQPGSTMKPLGVYALVIENDIRNYTGVVLDEPIKNYYGNGKSGPREWFGSYLGKVPLNYALRRSMNAVPVRLLDEVGIDTSYKFLTKKLGFKHLIKADKNASSLALGGCTYGITPTESAAAFAIFGNGGVYYEPTTYYKVVDRNNEIVLQENKKGKRAIGEDTATIMNHLLQEVVYKSGGTGTAISGYNWRMKAYAKTGTSSDTKDSWLVGGTPYYVGSVWYGFDHNQRVYNTSAAKSIWRDIMRQIHADLEVKQFEDSEEVYSSGGGYYKKGTSIGKVLKEDEYLKNDDEEEEIEEEENKKDKDKDKDKNKEENKKEPTASSKPESSNSTTSNSESSVVSSNPESSVPPTESTPSQEPTDSSPVDNSEPTQSVPSEEASSSEVVESQPSVQEPENSNPEQDTESQPSGVSE